MDHNRVHFIGRLTRNPEYFSRGRRGEGHCTFTVAINRVVPNEEGPMADYIPCSLWGEEAATFVERAHKGDEVAVRGRIRTNFVVQGDGNRRFFWEARIDVVDYGRISLKNLQPQPAEDATIRAVQTLTEEFGG